MLSPISPHITHHLWKSLTGRESILDECWPDPIENLLLEDTVKIAIQINGKLRSTIEINSDLEKQKIELKAKQDKKIKSYIIGKKIKKTIYVKNKILNLVLD